LVEALSQPNTSTEDVGEPKTEANWAGRLKTGVSGLDSMLSGGIPEGKQVLITGAPGVGKTLLSFQTLYNCAKSGIPSLYIALEEDTHDLLKNVQEAIPALSDVGDLMKTGMLNIKGQGTLSVFLTKGENASSTLDQMVSELDSIIKTTNPKVICIDSISLIKLLFQGEFEYRNALTHLAVDFRKSGITCLFISEMKSSDLSVLVFEQEYFIFDGIMALYESRGEKGRELHMEIVKMRGTKHSRLLAPYDITSNGFQILLKEV
jgi:KaiC/GvpD/RAD55 family RecA-like ATPase